MEHLRSRPALRLHATTQPPWISRPALLFVPVPPYNLRRQVLSRKRQAPSNAAIPAFAICTSSDDFTPETPTAPTH